jgi:hypothetical protein
MFRKWSQILRRLPIADVARGIPLVGPLVDCTLEDHSETLKQVFITLLLSTAPFWFGALILFATSLHTGLTIKNAFWSTVWDGELFMCATSLLAPIFWMALEDPPGARKFPSRLSHMLIIVLVVALASVFFALGIANNHLKEPFTFHFSVAIFSISVALLYLSTAYHANRLLDAPAVFRQDEADFSAKYRRHRR